LIALSNQNFKNDIIQLSGIPDKNKTPQENSRDKKHDQKNKKNETNLDASSAPLQHSLLL